MHAGREGRQVGSPAGRRAGGRARTRARRPLSLLVPVPSPLPRRPRPNPESSYRAEPGGSASPTSSLVGSLGVSALGSTFPSQAGSQAARALSRAASEERSRLLPSNAFVLLKLSTPAPVSSRPVRTRGKPPGELPLPSLFSPADVLNCQYILCRRRRDLEFGQY